MSNIQDRSDSNHRQVRELGTGFAPRFGLDGLIPAVVTDAETGALLMLAYMTAEALDRTLETGEAHYWSRSRGAIWKKGERSGHLQQVVEIRVDCDQDTLWLRVVQHGPGACHVGYRSCFYRRIEGAGTRKARLAFVEQRTFDPDSIYAPETAERKEGRG